MDGGAGLGAVRKALLSLHSGAQATTLSQLLTGVHPRHWLMEPIFVPFLVTLYLGLKPHFFAVCRWAGTNGKSLPFKVFALIHNLLLCAYSAWTASNVLPLTISYLRTHGAEETYCTQGLWDAGMQYWGFLFYLSKYWELADSMLLMVKGRSPSFLQVYHHAVTIVCAYWLQLSQASVTFIFVGFNATVHTIMYAYYALTVLGIRFKAKSAITSMQIIQFLSGIVLALPMFYLREGRCANQAQKIAVAALIVHVVYLTKLFADFWREAYGSKAKTV